MGGSSSTHITVLDVLIIFNSYPHNITELTIIGTISIPSSMDLHCFNYMSLGVSQTFSLFSELEPSLKYLRGDIYKLDHNPGCILFGQVFVFFKDQRGAPYKSERRALYRRFESTTIPDSARRDHVNPDYCFAEFSISNFRINTLQLVPKQYQYT
jgi:hypothetical protein